LTGSIYLFQPQIDNILYHNLYNIDEKNQPYLSADIVMKNIDQKFPNSKKLAYIPSPQANKSSLVRILDQNSKNILIGVNPYSAEIIASIDYKERIMAKIRNFHGKLFMGIAGKILVELFASWSIILLISGLYLWYKLKKMQSQNNLLKMLVPRHSPFLGRNFWREWHAFFGSWIALIIIFLVITGLPWSFLAGNIIRTIEHKTSTPETHIGRDFGGSKTLKSNDIEQGWINDHAQNLAGEIGSKNIAKKSLSLQQIIEIAQNNKNIVSGFEIRLPIDKNGVYSIINDSQKIPQNTAFIHIDQYSGEVLSQVLWRDFSIWSKMIAIGVALHEGKYFGTPNQIINLIGCLGLILVIISGYLMWFKRIKNNQENQHQQNYFLIKSSNNFIKILLIFFAIIMPTVAISLILILSYEILLKKK
jgi:uncharacterized iron-regulated membrane protein